MAEVYIESLNIENFGPYYGKHEFQFSSLDGRCGVLIGGKNGAGKTHLLRALFLASVGEGGRTDLTRIDKDSDSTRFMLEKSVNRRARAEGVEKFTLSVTIAQRDQENDQTRRVKLTREVRCRNNSPANWKSQADRLDGSPALDDDKLIEKLRDNFLPRDLARFFFFDAERSQGIDLQQRDIVEGITRIIGLYSYSQLEDDLRYLIQAKIPNQYKSNRTHEDSTKLAQITGKLTEVRELIRARHQEKAAVEVELRETESELGVVEDELRSLGAVDPEVLRQMQDNKSQIERTKGGLEEQLRAAWETSLPIVMMGKFRAELHDDLSREEKRRQWESSKDAVQPKIPQVKRDLFEAAPPEFALSGDVLAFYEARLDAALKRLFHPPPEGMSEQSPFLCDRNDTSAQVRARLLSAAASVTNLAQTSAQLDRLSGELRDLDGRLKGLVYSRASVARGEELHQKRGELSAARAAFARQLEDLRVEIGNLENLETELIGQEKVLSETVGKARKGQSLASVAARYREAVSRIKDEAAIQLRDQISEHVGELWTGIVGREREFAGLEFDNHWGCYLVRRGGERVAWDEVNTSAGQRQVRILAFYEALRRLARLVPPLVVDTPLGRLDKEVREAVLDKLYLSGHQSLILSTNSEIDPDSALFRSIAPRLARVYTLHPDGHPDSTDYQVRVSSDYFGRTL